MSNPPASQGEAVEILDRPSEMEDESEIDDLDDVSGTWAGRAIATDSGMSAASTAVMCDGDSVMIPERAREVLKRESVRGGELQRRRGSSSVASDDEDTVLFKGRKRQRL